jgi:MFS transporter, DHA1 family, multidrug resistance protein
MIGSFVVLLRSPAFLSVVSATSFTSASWFTFLASAPYLLAQRLHEPPSTYGLMILFPMAGYILGNAGVARLSVLLGSTRLFVLGLMPLRRANLRAARSPRWYPAPSFASSRSAAIVTRCVAGQGTNASIPPALIADAR